MKAREHARRIARQLQRQGVPYRQALRRAGRRVAAANRAQDEEEED